MPQFTPPPLSRTSNGSIGVKWSATRSIARYCSSWLFSLSESEDVAGCHRVVPGEPQDVLWWGCPNHRQRWVRCCHLIVDGPTQKVVLNGQGLGQIKFWNNGNFQNEMYESYFALRICFWSNLVYAVHTYMHTAYMFNAPMYLYRPWHLKFFCSLSICLEIGSVYIQNRVPRIHWSFRLCRLSYYAEGTMIFSSDKARGRKGRWTI